MSVQLPKGWQTIKFGDVVEDSAFGPRFSGEKYAEDGNIASLRTTDMSEDGRISYENIPLAKLDESKFEKHFLEVGDLVITRSGRIGTTGIFEGADFPVIPGAFLIRFRLYKTVNPYFYKYFFNSSTGQRTILSVARGAAQQNITSTNVLNLKVPCPPLESQNKIADILSRYDETIANNRRRIELLERSSRLLYREWFVHLRYPGHEHGAIDPDGIPEGWEKIPLGDVLTLQRGFDLPVAKRIEGNYPIYASTGINGYHEKLKVKAPGVVTGRSGSLGTVLYASEDFWPLNTTLWVKEFKKVDPIFAVYLLRNLHLEQYNGGAAVPTLNRNDVHRINVLCPSKRLLDLFHEFSSPIYEQNEKLNISNKKLQAARDLLLPRLMNGEINV